MLFTMFTLVTVAAGTLMMSGTKNVRVSAYHLAGVTGSSDPIGNHPATSTTTSVNDWSTRTPHIDYTRQIATAVRGAELDRTGRQQVIVMRFGSDTNDCSASYYRSSARRATKRATRAAPRKYTIRVTTADVMLQWYVIARQTLRIAIALNRSMILKYARCFAVIL